MCSFDAETVQVYREQQRRARKLHNCEVCGATIAPGTLYRYTSWVHEGTASDAKTCAWCSAVLDLFRHEHGSGPTPDWARQAIADCYEGMTGEWKRAPEAAIWRSAMAGILHRERGDARGFA